MKVVEFGGSAEIAKNVANIVADAVSQKPDLVLGLATGKTMVGLYKELVKTFEKRKIDFSRVRTFNLDEYFNLTSKSKNSMKSFMEENLFNYINLKKRNINFLDGATTEVGKESKRYEMAIKGVGGIDLQILGIGRNGHIGFNEPGSGLKSRTRKVKLTEITRKDNFKGFGTWRNVPDEALTMGVATILSAKKILLLATGESKEEAIRRTVHGKITEKVPASFLQKHKDVTVFVDRDAARGL